MYFDVNIHKKSKFTFTASISRNFQKFNIFFSRNGNTQKTSTSSGFSEEQQNESQSVCSDNSSNRSVDDKSDSGNDSDIKKVRKYKKYNLVKYLWSFGLVIFRKNAWKCKKYLENHENHKYDPGD